MVDRSMTEREQRVTPLELFFDLVFVYAFTQVTQLMTHDLTWVGVGHGLLVLAALWWAWTGYAWLTNILEPEEGVVRAGVFGAMIAMLVAAIAVPGAFGAEAILFGSAFLLVHPGFGVATAWAYQNLARFPEALQGRQGRAENLVRLLNTFDLPTAAGEFYNSLEAPVLEKYPVLEIYQKFLRERGAAVALMSGSGSTTFGIFSSRDAAKGAEEKVKEKFGPCWTAAVAV